MGVALARLSEGQPFGEIALAVRADELPDPQSQPHRRAAPLATRDVQVAYLSLGVLVDLSSGTEAVRTRLLRGADVAAKRDALGRQFDAVNDQVGQRQKRLVEVCFLQI